MERHVVFTTYEGLGGETASVFGTNDLGTAQGSTACLLAIWPLFPLLLPPRRSGPFQNGFIIMLRNFVLLPRVCVCVCVRCRADVGRVQGPVSRGCRPRLPQLRGHRHHLGTAGKNLRPSYSLLINRRYTPFSERVIVCQDPI